MPDEEGREVVRLAYLEEKNRSQVAREMGLSQNVRARAFKTLHKAGLGPGARAGQTHQLTLSPGAERLALRLDEYHGKVDFLEDRAER